jgi:hypothetical protein
MSHFFTFEVLPKIFTFLAVVSLVVIGGGVLYFVVRDLFRFGRRGIPVGWVIAIIALLAGIAFWAVRYPGLLIAPILGLAYGLGCRKARLDAADREGQSHESSS